MIAHLSGWLLTLGGGLALAFLVLYYVVVIPNLHANKMLRFRHLLLFRPHYYDPEGALEGYRIICEATGKGMGWYHFLRWIVAGALACLIAGSALWALA